MTMPNTTVKAFTEGVRNKGNFKQGYTRGVWFSPKEIDEDSLGGLPVSLRRVILTQNGTADLFVVYSYSTPIAWFSLKDSDSNGTNKWYFPTVRYSEQMDQHQHQMRWVLRQMAEDSNVKYAKILPDGKQMK